MISNKSREILVLKGFLSEPTWDLLSEYLISLKKKCQYNCLNADWQIWTKKKREFAGCDLYPYICILGERMQCLNAPFFTKVAFSWKLNTRHAEYMYLITCTESLWKYFIGCFRVSFSLEVTRGEWKPLEGSSIPAPITTRQRSASSRILDAEHCNLYKVVMHQDTYFQVRNLFELWEWVTRFTHQAIFD